MVERKPCLLLCAAVCLLIPAGCASPPTYLGQSLTDPPRLSPYNRPLNANVPPAAGDQRISGYRGLGGFFGPWMGTPAAPPAMQSAPTPVRPAPSRPQQGPIELGQPLPLEPSPIDELETQLGTPRTYREEGVPTYPDPPSSEGDDRQTIRRRQDPDTLQAPSPAEESPAQQTYDPATQPLELEVSDPQQVLLAESANFEVVIRNPFAQPVEEVVILVRFDEGLSFPGMPDRALRQRLGTLAASESRTLDLPLKADVAGRHCVRFTLSAEGRAETHSERCVQAIDPQTSTGPIEGTGGIAIQLVGPPERNAGGSLECLLTIENRTGREASGIVATIHHDMALVPREASAGAIRDAGTLAWDLGLLRIDERVQIQVEFACPNRAEQACIDAEVRGRNLPTQRQVVCVKVHPRPTLDVAIADVRDPVPVAETTTYRVTLTNRGLTPINGVRIDVEVDGGLEILPDEQSVSGASLQAGAASTAKTASWTISETIPPDESSQLLIDVRGTSVGRAGLRVAATELSSGRRFQIEEPTMVNPPLLELPTFEDIAGTR